MQRTDLFLSMGSFGEQGQFTLPPVSSCHVTYCITRDGTKEKMPLFPSEHNTEKDSTQPQSFHSSLLLPLLLLQLHRTPRLNELHRALLTRTHGFIHSWAQMERSKGFTSDHSRDGILCCQFQKCLLLFLPHGTSEHFSSFELYSKSEPSCEWI